MKIFIQILLIFFVGAYTSCNSYELNKSKISTIYKLINEAFDKKQYLEIINICEPLLTNKSNINKYSSNDRALSLIKYCHHASAVSYNIEGQQKKACDLSERSLKLLPKNYLNSLFHGMISYCYLAEKGRSRDYNKALYHLNESINLDPENAESLNNLGLLYLSDEEAFPGIGLANIKNWNKAKEYFVKSALIKSVNGVAETSLGWMYQTGDKDFPKNYKKGFQWNTRGCENRNTNGCSNVAWSFFTGNGAKQNFHKMVSYLIKSIEYFNENYQWILSQEDRWEKETHLAPEYFFEARTLYWNVLRNKSERHFKELVSLLDFNPNFSKKSNPQRKKLTNKKTQVSSGTGFSINKNGHVLTNYHVIDGCDDVYVIYKDKQYEGEIIAFDVVNDLALIKADKKNKLFLNFSNKKPELLSEVFVAGFPFGKNLSSSIKVTKGIISSLSGLGNNVNQVQIDAAIQPGNSGGPILNNKGNLVGIAVAKLDLKKIIKDFGTIPENVNFGIKSTTVGNFLQTNGVTFKTSSSFFKMNSKKLGKLINASTHYISCWMSGEKVTKLKSRKVFFDEFNKED